MGVTIYYRGTLAPGADRAELAREITDISKTNGWEVKLLQRDLTKEENAAALLNHVAAAGAGAYLIEGVAFRAHPDTHWVSLFLTPDDRLLRFGPALDPLAFPWNPELIQWVRADLQEGGADNYFPVINLLRYLGKKYFADFELKDETGYYDTSNEANARETYARYKQLTHYVTDALSSVDLSGAETPEELKALIERVLPGAQVRLMGEEE